MMKGQRQGLWVEIVYWQQTAMEWETNSNSNFLCTATSNNILKPYFFKKKYIFKGDLHTKGAHYLDTIPPDIKTKWQIFPHPESSFNRGSFFQTRGITYITVIHQSYCRNAELSKPSALWVKIHPHVMGWTRWKLSIASKLAKCLA